jgi:hypothetical protein
MEPPGAGSVATYDPAVTTEHGTSPADLHLDLAGEERRSSTMG